MRKGFIVSNTLLASWFLMLKWKVFGLKSDIIKERHDIICSKASIGCLVRKGELVSRHSLYR